jgi:hypothetical protein
VIVLLGLICCWLALNAAAGGFLVLRHRARSENGGLPSVARGRRIVTTPGPEFRAEQLQADTSTP